MCELSIHAVLMYELSVLQRRGYRAGGAAEAEAGEARCDRPAQVAGQRANVVEPPLPFLWRPAAQKSPAKSTFAAHPTKSRQLPIEAGKVS